MDRLFRCHHVVHIGVQNNEIKRPFSPKQNSLGIELVFHV